jgi:hypothetical protein
MFPLPDRIRRRGFKGAILISPYVLRTNSGSLAIFAAILRAPSLLSNLVAVRRLLTPKRKMFAKNSNKNYGFLFFICLI